MLKLFTRYFWGDQASDQPEVTSDQPEFFTIAQKPYGIMVSAKG